ncbi:hypothetical protein PMAYCL1PPCAC_25943 [Pristionchus mayeri]|uniref:G protein-coupled receptor n=1 Tax=Pristionchus mayeri TaxID=1317129 RepID=A0AAN5D396_9BILA|nr:hypothetical protein PMAYCL1PPCAC_25943 [Pristionchus mayeri]
MLICILVFLPYPDILQKMPIGDTTAAQRLVESISAAPEPEVCPRTSFARIPAENLVRRYAFPLTFAAAHLVIARSMWRMARKGDRNVGKLTLFLLGVIELAMFWTFLPTALGAFETFYSAETFRRFFHATTPLTGSFLNILSGCDTFLTLLVCYEFRLVAENAKARAIFSSIRRQVGVYATILFVSLAVSAFTFGVTYTPLWRCGGARMDVRPVYLISANLMRAGQYIFGAIVIAVPCALLAHTNARLARFVGYSTLPSEANELISCKTDASLCKLRRLLVALTVAFVVPHVSYNLTYHTIPDPTVPFHYRNLLQVLSLAPLVLTPPTVSVITTLSTMSITNWLLFVSRVVCYALLHQVTDQLARMGVVNCY